MCALFGWLDYKHIIPYKALKKLTQALANAAEERGTDASGISYIKDDRVTIFKRSVYGKTRKEVAEKLNAVLHNKQTGSYVTPSKTMFKEWLIQWLQNYASVAGLHKRYNHKQSDSRNSNSTSGKA